MRFRINPLWWPIGAATSLLWLPWLASKARRFRAGMARASAMNDERIDRAQPLALPALDWLEITVLVEYATSDGFVGDAGVSYLVRTERGSVLYDVAFGGERPALAHNAARLGVTEAADALVISHLHPDHMGGLAAVRRRRVVPGPGISAPPRCYVPGRCRYRDRPAEVMDRPALIEAGLATTGPLARMLFFEGHTEEQAIIARVRDKGVVIVTGCGHPTIGRIVQMVRRLVPEPVYAIAGGMHLPVEASRMAPLGIAVQQILGTGKPPWQRMSDADISETIEQIKEAAPRRLLLSAHDSCDHSLARIGAEVSAQTEVLRAGVTYRV